MAGEENIERDVAAALPVAPPPAQARREAAIAEAMRSFDAESGAVRASKPGGPSVPRRGALRNRPQLAGLIAVSLALMLGVPIAWRELSGGNSTLTRSGGQSAIDVVAPPSRTVVLKEEPRLAQGQVVPPTRPSGTPPLSIVAPRAVPPPPPPPPEAPAPMVAPVVAAAPEPSPSPARREERNQAGTPGSASMVGAAPAPPSRVATATGQASLDAAPARKATRQAATDELADVVVTAKRVRDSGHSYLSTRGDWNACTIDDPRQSLAACRTQIKLGAHGAKAEVATFLAEGLTQAWQGDGQRAIAAFDQAIAVAPKSWLAWLNRGLARANSGDSAGALADLDQAARLAPQSARVHYALGRLARAQGDDRRARSEFRRAVELDPAYAELDE